MFDYKKKNRSGKYTMLTLETQIKVFQFQHKLWRYLCSKIKYLKITKNFCFKSTKSLLASWYMSMCEFSLLLSRMIKFMKALEIVELIKMK